MADRAPDHNWRRAWRELAEARDYRLGDRAVLSSGRRATLHAALVRAFPVEAGLRDAVAERDRRLENAAREIPRPVMQQLHRCLTNQRPARHRHAGMRWMGALPVAACLGLGLGLLFLAKWDATSGRSREVARSGARAVSPLTLRLSAAELASRRADSFAINPFPQREDAAQLRLDLPVQALLENGELARTP